MKKIVMFITAVVFLFLFFSYKLTSIPKGITGDEAAFGYNATLLSRTLHDENGRKLPVFVLSLGGTDWRQPVTQYFITAYFKVFGPSLFNLRFTTVIIAVLSILLVYFLSVELFGNRILGLLSAFLLGSAPIFMIHSHLGLDNIYPIPFVLSWLYGILKYSKTKNKNWLILSSVSLGVGLYAYKAMRVFVPVWLVLSLFFVFSLKDKKPVYYFVLSILPFLLIIPKLEFLYAGAVLNNEKLGFPGVYEFIYRYISNFDLSFLFIKGDALLFHSTGKHGMYLISTLPLFVFGIIQAFRKDKFWRFVVLSFFLGPILFGFLGQVGRASRLMAEIPLFALISTLGFWEIWKYKYRIFAYLLGILLLLNYFDFLRYYFSVYPNETEKLFNCFSCSEKAYQVLREQGGGKVPFIDEVLSKKEGETQWFARSVHFRDSINVWNGKIETLPEGAVLMTDNDNLVGLQKVDQSGSYYFYSKN